MNESRYRHFVFTGADASSRPEPYPTAEVVSRPSPATGASGRVSRGGVAREPEEQPLGAEESDFLQQVLARAGVDRQVYRPQALARRLPACLRILRARTVAEASERLGRNPERMEAVISALMIGMTGFFRDASVFDELSGAILPELLRGRPRVRVWSVACSDGAELYSVGMLFDDRGELERGAFYGMDCRTSAIAAARRSSYPRAMLEEIPDQLRQRYFIREGNGYTITPRLQAAMHWAVGDVFEAGGTASYDLILCRNLAIYLTSAASVSLWSRLARSLTSDGILIVGKAERPAVPGLRRIGHCIYQKE